MPSLEELLDQIDEFTDSPFDNLAQTDRQEDQAKHEPGSADGRGMPTISLKGVGL